MTRFKMIAGLAGVLALILVGWTARGWMDGRDMADMTARAEKAEKIVADLTLANAKLEVVITTCNLAAAAQSAASAAALARRETLDDIMTCPAPAAVAASQKGEALNENQDSQMVAYWNSLYSGLGLRSQ